MSGFCVKYSLCKAVLREDFADRSMEDICDYLSFLFWNDESKRYYVINTPEMGEKHSEKNQSHKWSAFIRMDLSKPK